MTRGAPKKFANDLVTISFRVIRPDYEKALQAMKSTGENLSEYGRRAIKCLNQKTILPPIQ